MANEASRSWFAVFNNPADHNYIGSPEEVCERLKKEWCTSDTRAGAWLYCVSAEGLHHVHMVLEDVVVMRFSKIKKEYACGMHFEATKGNKKQAEDYINKVGKWEEKGEEILYKCVQGDIKGSQGKRSDLDTIEQLLEAGNNPRDILAESFSFYRYETSIRKAYFDKKDRETPSIREVKVIWHTGESGSGKSYSRLKLEETVGTENIFYLTDYTPSSMFDGYYGQDYLWIEDFKGNIKFGDLLRYLDVYKCDLHARYANAKSLWKEVHITSVLHPLGAYRRMISYDYQYEDKSDQLLRRITCIRYHYKEGQAYKYKDFPVTLTLEEMRKATLYNPFDSDKSDFTDMDEPPS